MGVTDKVGDAHDRFLKMDDKVVSLAGTVKEQQLKIDGPTERVIRIEATLELMHAYRQRHEKAAALTGSKLMNVEYKEQWRRQL